MSRPRRRIVVVIPAYNEALMVGDVLASIPRSVDDMDVLCLVVDDGSTDNTEGIARTHGAVTLRHIVNLGVGAATRTGLRAAKEFDPDVVVTIDADGQHDASEIALLVRCLVENNYDVVIGSRIHLKGMPALRVAANLFLNAIMFVAYRKVVSDSQSGFKAFNRRSLSIIELDSAGYEICSEIIGEIVRNKLNYKSLPVKAVYTQYSRAKGQPLLNGINLVLNLFERKLRRVKT